MKKLIFAFLAFSLNSLASSPLRGQPQSDQRPGHQKNYYNCLHGYSECDASQLTDAERTGVQQAAHRRNYNNCLHGYSGCDLSQLTSSETQAVSEAGRESSAGKPAPSQTAPPRYYTNKDGQRVQSPTYSDTIPAGATAQCRDGTYSFSLHRRGTCSHHGGVARWL